MEIYFWIKLCVFIDFLGVAFVVPLLSSYFRAAGVDTEMYGLISSLYYLSQIVGGLVMGSLTDILPRRNILILSFIGSAISYAMVGFSESLWVLFASRILVGSVKQTYTISTAIISSTCNDTNRRAELLGHLSAAITLAFIIGPSIGSMLYAAGSHYPAIASSSLFMLNVVICLWAIPCDISPASAPSGNNTNSSSANSGSMWEKLQSVFHVKDAACPLIAMVLMSFVERSMTNSNLISYFEIRYNIETGSVGYVSSATALVSFLAHTYFVKLSISMCGGSERLALVYALLLCCIANLLEYTCSDIFQYLVLFVPLYVAGSNVMQTLSRTVMSEVVPSEHIGKTMGVLGILDSGVGVIAPLYGSELFMRTGYNGRALAAAAHYALTATAVWVILFKLSRCKSDNVIDKDPSENSSNSNPSDGVRKSHTDTGLRRRKTDSN